jgi:hypothetical protein
MSGKCKQGGIVGVVILMGGGAAIIIVLNDWSPFQGLQKPYSRKAFREVRGLEKKDTLKIDRERERERK